MFVRVKIISGKPYAYLVENTWKKGKVKQKVKKYLGPVVKFDKVFDTSFEEWKDVDLEAYVSNTPVRKIFRDIINHTLAMHGFDGNKNGNVHRKANRFLRNDRDVVLELDSGYMHKYSVSKVVNFKPVEEERAGEKLAEAFMQAGIPIEKQLFILLYRKVYNV